MQSAPGAVIAADNLSRRFGSRTAVDGVSFTVGRGEVLSLFGPNGAGKTTLLRLIGGLIRPTGGSARIEDTTLPGGPAIRRRVGLVSHHTLLYDALTPRENVEFVARLYGVRDYRESAERALGKMQILDRADTPVRSLSRGMRQRVSVARAIVHNPSVILADEPYTGLDVGGASALTSLLQDLTSAGACLVIVTHHLDEGLALATRAAVMHRGRIVAMKDRSEISLPEFAAAYQLMVTTGE
jgi:heme exporter protein A